METCPACNQACIPAWRRWVSSRTFDCRRCSAPIRSKVPSSARLSARHSNIALFVIFPLFIVAMPVVPLLVGSLFHEHRKEMFFAALGIFALAVLLGSLRQAALSVYAVAETQKGRSDIGELREAWRGREFRIFVFNLAIVLGPVNTNASRRR